MMWPSCRSQWIPARSNFLHLSRISKINWQKIFMKCGRWEKSSPVGHLVREEMTIWATILASHNSKTCHLQRRDTMSSLLCKHSGPSLQLDTTLAWTSRQQESELSGFPMTHSCNPMDTNP